MTLDDLTTLLNDTENTLIARRKSTSDASEKETLTKEIEQVRRMQDMVDLLGLLDAAARLNELSGVIERATAALRTQPFDAILGAYQSLLDRIGDATGRIVRLEKPALAEDEEDAVPADGGGGVGAAVTPGGGAAAAVKEAPVSKLAQMYASCKLRADQVPVIDHFYVKPVVRNRATYEQVGSRLGIPWWFVGVIHGLESAFSLSTHLHNGDPLTARTVHVPPGRPPLGSPPFTWMESAIDAMQLKNFDGLADWSIGVTLDRLERYNGLGYRKRGLPSPYLWSFSEHYEKGKFVADGKFDPNAVSKQCGGAALIKRLEQKGLVTTEKPLDTDAGAVASVRESLSPAPRPPATPAAPAAAPVALDLPDFVKKAAKAELDFPGRTAKGDKDSTKTARKVHRVQAWCSFHDCQTAIDGIFGGGTEAAVREFQRKKGLEPTGAVNERTWAAMTEPMQRALAPVEVSPGETIYDVVLRVARIHLDIHPVEFAVRGEGNRGPWVRLYMLGKEGTSQPWCAGFVSHIIGQAAHAMGEDMPIKREVSVDMLVQDAKRDGRFLEGTKLTTTAQRRDKIRKGSLFVVRRTATDWTHVGIVTDVGEENFATIEGNTNDAGEREGYEVCARQRGYDKRDFLLLI